MFFFLTTILSLHINVIASTIIDSKISFSSSHMPPKTGDFITITVTIDSKDIFTSNRFSEILFYPEPKDQWINNEPVLIDSYSLKVEKDKNLENRIHCSFKALIINPVKKLIPEIRFQFSSKNLLIKTPPLKIASDSVIKNKSNQPKYIMMPIKKEIRSYWLFFALLGLFLIIIILIVILLFKVLEKRRVREKYIPPQETFNQTLDDLRNNIEKSSTLTLSQWKSFSYDLSKSIRIYLQSKFNIDLLDLTDNEMIPKLRNSDIPKSATDKFQQILVESDEVRYGRLNLSQEAAKNHLTSAKEILRSCESELDKKTKSKKRTKA